MDEVDKTQAMINYLLTCPAIKSNPLFFNFAETKDNNKQIVVNPSDTRTNVQYIDGSVLKRDTFTLIDYKSVVYQSLPKVDNPSQYPNENVDDFLDVQSIINWIDEQNTLSNFPDFGESCIIDSIEALSNKPTLNGVDTSTKPNTAKYSISIRVTYLDNSKVIFK